MKITRMSFGGGPYDDRHGSDGQPTTDGGQQPGTPDPGPGPATGDQPYDDR